MFKSTKSFSILLSVLLIFVISLMPVNAAGGTVYFQNGGRGAITVERTWVSGTAFSNPHYDWAVRATVIATREGSGTRLQIGPSNGYGLVTVYKENVYFIAGAQGIFMVNGETQYIVRPAGWKLCSNGNREANAFRFYIYQKRSQLWEKK